MSQRNRLITARPITRFLIGTISVMPDNFPSETSLNATYESSLQQLKNGKYDNARFLEIDGIEGASLSKRCPKKKIRRAAISGSLLEIIRDKTSSSKCYAFDQRKQFRQTQRRFLGGFVFDEN